MGWLKRLFGLEKPQNAQVNPAPQTIQQQPSAPAATQQI
ncbi:phospholipid-binding protein, partial [Fischerella thermalis WC249]